jgi:hypothetical protein
MYRYLSAPAEKIRHDGNANDQNKHGTVGHESTDEHRLD